MQRYQLACLFAGTHALQCACMCIIREGGRERQAGRQPDKHRTKGPGGQG